MWWYGRWNRGGSWLPEEKKANMWHGRGNSGGSWPPAFPRSKQSTSCLLKYFQSGLIFNLKSVENSVKEQRFCESERKGGGAVTFSLICLELFVYDERTNFPKIKSKTRQIKMFWKTKTFWFEKNVAYHFDP